jgi:hypothetical protein
MVVALPEGGDGVLREVVERDDGDVDRRELDPGAALARSRTG